MAITQRDKDTIRDLAKRVADIAALPVQQHKRELWTRINRLERVRPTIHVQAIAQSIWVELLPESELETTDPFCRQQEMALRRKIYCWEHFPDDRVVDNVVASPVVVRGECRSADFGMTRDYVRPDAEFGAYLMKNAIQQERDIDKIRTESTVTVDWDETDKCYTRLAELYGDTLVVQKRGRDFFWLPVMDVFIGWRGIEQMFIDLIDRPSWVHEALEKITVAYLSDLEQMEKLGALSLGNRNTALGSGGYAWTDELPQPDFDGTHVRLKDLWARCATQIFTDGISPAMHDEFAIQYEKRLLERFGLSTYGCCEPLHNKMHVVRKIGNLRRVSMSPWVDIDVASAEVGKDYVYTHKPNPTIISMEGWHPELARAELRDAFEKTRDNVVEVNLQDIHTVRNEPHRLDEWTRIALELAQEYA